MLLIFTAISMQTSNLLLNTLYTVKSSYDNLTVNDEALSSLGHWDCFRKNFWYFTANSGAHFCSNHDWHPEKRLGKERGGNGFYGGIHPGHGRLQSAIVLS